MLQYLAHSFLLLWPFVLVPGKKRRKKKTKTTNPPQPVVDSNAEETQPAAERFWPAVQRATLQHGSTKPGLTLQYQTLHPRARAQPPGAPAQERPSPDPHLLPQWAVCVASSALTFQLYFITWMYQNRPHSMYTSIYCSKKKLKIVVYRPTTDIYVCVCVYTCKAVCVCVCMCVHG